VSYIITRERTPLRKLIRNGAHFEEYFFGTTKIASSEPPHAPRNMAIREIIKRNQGRKRILQEASTSSHILRLVRDNFPERVRCKIQLFNAIGTTLDYHHGIDGFFELKRGIATFDLTLRSDKDILKANLFITPEDLDSMENMEQLASSIAEILKGRNDYNILDF